MESIRQQTYTDYEIVIVKGVSPQGKAINQGVAQARGSVILILDDDSRVADETVFASLIDTLDSDPRIGMAGASIVVPPEANAFQLRAARQFPRFNTPVVDAITDSDLACHGCCVFRREVFEEVGGEREDIIRGLDPDLRVRLRRAGYRVVLAPNARIYHPLPGSLRKLVKVFFRNGVGSAYAKKFRPDSVYETSETLEEEGFKPRTSLLFRVVRYPFRLGRALATGEWLRFAAYTSYAFGYVWGILTAKESDMAPKSGLG